MVVEAQFMEFMKTWPLVRGVILACACALLAGGGVLAFSPSIPTVEVTVSTRPFSSGDSLTAADFTVVRIPVEAAPQDAFTREEPLPHTWEGTPIASGTILTESNVLGSAAQRKLTSDEARISIILDSTHMPSIEVGDRVDLWGLPVNCGEDSCPATLISSKVRIASITVRDGSQWDSAQPCQLDLIVNPTDQGKILGHAGTGTLSLSLRSSTAHQSPVQSGVT